MQQCKYCGKILTPLEVDNFGDACEEHHKQFEPFDDSVVQYDTGNEFDEDGELKELDFN